MKYGLTAKQLSKIKIDWKAKPEFIDVEGFFYDGMIHARNGRELRLGGIKLPENIKAYTDGYNSYKK